MDTLERLAKERRGRLAAERLLEQKSRELFAANAKLALHARALSDQIVEQREVVKTALTEAEILKGQNSRFLMDLDRAHTAAVMDGLSKGQAQTLRRPHLVVADIADVIYRVAGQYQIQLFEQRAWTDLPIWVLIGLRSFAHGRHGPGTKG